MSEESRVVNAADRAGFDVGVYRKFKVERVDGSSEPGRKHHICGICAWPGEASRFFVLRPECEPTKRKKARHPQRREQRA